MPSLRIFLALFIGALSASAASPPKDHENGASAEHGALVPAKEASAEWLAKAKTEYPTNQCVVSDDKLGGDMGAPQDYVYKVEGKPDRLVRFCCKDCVKDFKKDPAKYLSAIDKAAAGKTSPSKDSGKDSHHAH